MSSPNIEATPLSQRERLQAARTLSDPTSYPLAMKSWILSFIEGSDIDLPMQNVHGLLDALEVVLPRGTVLLHAGAEPPLGTLPLDGSIVMRGEHPQLFALLRGNPAIHVLDTERLRLPNMPAPHGLTYVLVT